MLDRQSVERGEVAPPPRLCTVRCAVRVVAVMLVVLAVGACDASSGGLERVRAAGVLRVAIDPSFPPFESVNGAGEVEGLDVDLIHAVAAELGVQVQLVTTGYDALYDALTAGRADVIVSALYPDPSRSHAFLFTQPYFDAGHVLVVRAGSEVGTLDDLAGRSLVCVFGTTGHMAVLDRARRMSPPPEVLTVDHPVTLTQLLHTGEVSAAVTDRVSALIAAGEDAELHILDPPVAGEPYVIAVRKEDASLAKAIEAALDTLATEGTLQAFVERWMQP